MILFGNIGAQLADPFLLKFVSFAKFLSSRNAFPMPNGVCKIKQLKENCNKEGIGAFPNKWAFGVPNAVLARIMPCAVVVLDSICLNML